LPLNVAVYAIFRAFDDISMCSTLLVETDVASSRMRLLYDLSSYPLLSGSITSVPQKTEIVRNVFSLRFTLALKSKPALWLMLLVPVLVLKEYCWFATVGRGYRNEPVKRNRNRII
jgi:hypothetical protein